MSVGEFLEYTCDFQNLKILSFDNKVIYDGNKEDLPYRFKPSIFKFFTYENGNMMIHL